MSDEVTKDVHDAMMKCFDASWLAASMALLTTFANSRRYS